MIVKFIIFATFTALITLSGHVHAQTQMSEVKELEIEVIYNEESPFKFTNYKTKAAIILNSELKLDIKESESNSIIDIIGLKTENQLILIVEPVDQTITISVAGFKSEEIEIKGLRMGESKQFNVSPKNRFDGKGTIVVQTIPEGATLTLGNSEEYYTSNHTFSDLTGTYYQLRVTKINYKEVVRDIYLNSDEIKLVRIKLEPTIGYLTVSPPDAILHLKKKSEKEFRVNYRVNQPVELPIGTYDYRIEKEYHLTETGTIIIKPLETTQLNMVLRPAYGTLRIYSNVQGINLTADNNNAPISDNRYEINLMYGLRKVTISADGYISKNIILRIEPGQILTDTLKLEPKSKYRDRKAKKNLPKGILKVNVDVDAEIYINKVKRGEGEISLPLSPDSYEVEVSHPLGSRRLNIIVLPSEVSGYNFFLKPLRSRTVLLSTLAPGFGHIYRKSKRGYLYTGLTAAMSTATILSLLKKNRAIEEYETAQETYNISQSIESASENRIELLSRYQKVRDIDSNIKIMAGITATIYILQLFDAILTKPIYGYRKKGYRSLSMSAHFNGATLTARF